MGRRFVILFFITICAFAGNANPIISLMITLNELHDSFSSFEEIEKRLQQITPEDCQIDEVKYSKHEVSFLLSFFLLDIAIELKQGEKALKNVYDIEKNLSLGSVDMKKLSDLFEINFEAVIDIDIPQAYVITNQSEKVINRINESLKKYPKDSHEYIMLRFTLGTAFCKIGQPQLSIEPLKTAFAYFDKKEIKTMAGMAASNLSSAYLMLDDMENYNKYRLLAEKYALDSNSELINMEVYLAKIVKLFMEYCENSEDKSEHKLFDEKQKQEFEECRQIILSKSHSDLQIWATYTISSIIKELNGYPIEDRLADLEKAFIYRSMIWGDIDAVDNSLKEIDDLLEVMKDELIDNLVKLNDTSRLSYWTLQFEKSRQRKSFWTNAIDNNAEMTPLIEMVSKYESANQILVYELSKKEEDRDKSLVTKASEIKRHLERQFEDAKKKMSLRDKSAFAELLTDNFIIHPDSLGQLSSVLPAGVACVQYLLLGENVIVYVIVKDAPPFVTTVSLNKFNLSNKDFIKCLLKTRSLLQTGKNTEHLSAQLTKVHSILFSEIEPSLKKLNISRLVINSSGVLRYIPFAALYDGEQYLISKYQVTNITGLDLIRLAKNTPKRNTEQASIAIFADPDGSLPQGLHEGEEIYELFSKANFFSGENATIKEFEALIGNVNFVHLATHAVLDPNNPAQSYIQFANGEKWYYSDMMGFNIKNVDSIALSACSTAMSEKSTGGEIEGMAYQLLRKSPSGSVLASFWPVDDEATAELMLTYYTHIVNSIKTNGTLDRGGALREAQLKLLGNPKTSSPYYWAAFTLFGDFR